MSIGDDSQACMMLYDKSPLLRPSVDGLRRPIYRPYSVRRHYDGLGGLQGVIKSTTPAVRGVKGFTVLPKILVWAQPIAMVIFGDAQTKRR